MIRSTRFVFVSHCILAQGVRANGLAKYYPAMVRPIIEFCLEHDINIVQMPCPEVMCGTGGLGRDPHGKKWYEERGLRETAKRIARGQVQYMRALIEDENRVLAVIGMDFSPACAPNYLNRGRRIVRDEGIYVEELKRELELAELEVRFIGVNQRALKKLDRELRSLIESDDSSDARPCPHGMPISLKVVGA